MSTKRKLKDGANGMRIPTDNLSSVLLDTLQARYSSLCDSAVAMQSLDDLGSPEENQQAWEDMKELERRINLIKVEIEARGKIPRWR